MTCHHSSLSSQKQKDWKLEVPNISVLDDDQPISATKKMSWLVVAAMWGFVVVI